MKEKHIFAEEVLQDFFGEVIRNIGHALLMKKRMTLTDLMETTKIDFATLRNSLILLIKLGIVKFIPEHAIFTEILAEQTLFYQELDEASQGRTKKSKQNEKNKQKQDELSGPKNPDEVRVFYEIDVDAVLVRLKHSIYELYIRDKFGAEGEVIFEELVSNGSQTKSDLIKQVTNRIIEKKNEQIQQSSEFDEPEPKFEVISGVVKSKLSQMTINRFVTRVNLQMEEIHKQILKNHSGKSGEDASTSANLKKKMLELSKKDQQEKEEEEKIRKERKRKREEEEGSTSTESSDSKKKKRKTEKSSKKKKNDMEEDEEAKTGDLDDDDLMGFAQLNEDALKKAQNPEEDDDLTTLWSLSIDQLARTFRNQTIVNYVKKKLNPTCGDILEIMFQLSSPMEKTKHDDTSILIRFDELYKAIQASRELDLSKSNLEKYLNIMDSNEIVQKMSETSYVVRIAHNMHEIRKNYIESIIEQKFGLVGCRIIRILHEKKLLEQRQIAEIAMVPLNTARNLLYVMMKAGFVKLQEVPKSTDHAANRTFFLWGVDMKEIEIAVEEVIYRVMRNLRLRLAAEQRKLIDKIGGNLNALSNLSEEQQQVVTRLERVEDKLESCLLKFNGLTMVF